ncbi:MAG: hypothetical protein DME22_08155 [Verrucomicrobia bacterium]|nr:MAG: hypothetical protein DME22_08155 [Verrucomicrobiota bacterium]
MKTSRVCKTAPVIAILFGSIFHADPASAEGCPTPNFAAARTFDVGAEGRPFCVAIGDFNGDGQLDLVVANYGCPACPSPVSGSVSILLGHGDGAFQSVAKYDAGPNPQAVVVGDFNGDGKPDLAVANNGSTNVAVLLGNGDATFQTAISYGVGGTPPPPYAATGVLAIGDFNRDGKVDLAVANSGGVSVLSGKGDGTFQNAVNYATGGSASSVVVGDFNGDGKPDLAANNGGGVSVLLGNGDGSFQAAVNYGTGGSTSSVVAGDFNGDGKTDLAVATATTPASSDNVSVLLGNGDGTFQAAVHYVVGSFPYSVTAGDLTMARETSPVLSSRGTSTATASSTLRWPTASPARSPYCWAMETALFRQGIMSGRDGLLCQWLRATSTVTASSTSPSAAGTAASRCYWAPVMARSP